MDADDLILGVDLGGTKTLTAVVTSRGRILSRDYRTTPAKKGRQAVIQSILESVHRALAEANVSISALSAIGVGVPGISNSEMGILFSSPHLPGWQDVPLRDIIEERLGQRTFLANDANAGALGELYFGAAQGVSNFIYVTISTGIGGGIVIGGKLYSGVAGVAGEVGHMTIDDSGPTCDCGNKGCWETLASGTALAREAKRRIKEGASTSILGYTEGEIENVTAEVIHKAARHGDTLAEELVARAAHYIGVGLINLVNIFNPELIVIGGGLSNMGDMLFEPAFKMVQERAYQEAFQNVRYTLAALGRDCGVVGAAAFALHEMRRLGSQCDQVESF